MSNHETNNTIKNITRNATRTILAMLLLAATIALMPAGPADAASPIRVTARGDLIVTGTNGDDEITLTSNGPGHVSITTRHQSGGTDENYQLNDVTGSITFNLRGGDDTIWLSSAVDVGKNLTINWGSGRSLLGRRGSGTVSVAGNLTILDRNDGTSLYLDHFRVAGRTRLSLGGGTTYINMKQSVFDRDFTASTSSTGEFTSFKGENVRFIGRVNISGGGKSDNIDLEGARFDDLTRFSLRGGDDTLTLEKNFVPTRLFGRTNISMGSGDDRIEMINASVHELFSLRMDGGNDFARVTDSYFEKRPTFNGGAGTDNLTAQQNIFAAGARLLGFES